MATPTTSKDMSITQIYSRRVFTDKVDYYVMVRRRSTRGRTEGSRFPGFNQLIWLDEDEITDKALIERFDNRTLRGARLESIAGATPVHEGTPQEIIYFYVKMSQAKKTFGAWVSSQLMKKRYPQELIRFYEENLDFKELTLDAEK